MFNKIEPPLICFLDVFFRWEATQMPGLWESVQPELQPYHTQQETHRVQTFRLRPLRQRFPEKSGSEETQRDAARTEMKRSLLTSCHVIWVFKSWFLKRVRPSNKDIFWYFRPPWGHFLDQDSLWSTFSFVKTCKSALEISNYLSQ